MIKHLALNNIGHKGLNSDMEPWELPPEFITQGINFRVRNGALSPLNGSNLIIDPIPGGVDAGWLMNVLVASESEDAPVIKRQHSSGWQTVSGRGPAAVVRAHGRAHHPVRAVPPCVVQEPDRATQVRHVRRLRLTVQVKTPVPQIDRLAIARKNIR